MRSKLFSIPVLLILFACSDDDNNPTYPFERTVLDVSIAKRCIDGSSAPGTNCYLMRWQHPIEKIGLHSYCIWLDTTVVKNSDENISQSQIDQASSVKAYNGNSEGDSLDLTALISEFLKRDSLHIAIWARYAGKEQGIARHINVRFGDDIKPSIVNFSDSANENTIWINWFRPTDQRDFYLPEEINGPIAGYNVEVKAVNQNENIKNSAVEITLAEENVTASKFKRSFEFYKSSNGVALKNVNQEFPYSIQSAIIDGKGFISQDMLQNSWEMVISGLTPERSYSVTIVAYDSAGNATSYTNRVATTDRFPPNKVKEFRYDKDSRGEARLDSNRLILFWERSLDPISPTQTPDVCYSGSCYREVKSYSLELWNGKNWDTIPGGPLFNNTRYKLENGLMIRDYNGEFVSDTLRWISPGDIVSLRLRAIDSSGRYSEALIDNIIVSKGELWQYKCPQDFAAVKKGDSDVFCMEKLEHISDNKFERNVLYIEAKKSCENLSYHLCTEDEWDAACGSGGSLYGVIQERDFLPSNFLNQHCGVGTGDSFSAIDKDRRSKICTSPDGIRDLPGQLQEWVTGDSAGKQIPLLKGTSYAIFEGASKTELALCKNRFKPTRIRPRYTTDTAWLYTSGSRADTLFAKDSLRSIPIPLLPSSFKDTILIYTLKSKNSDNPLGEDYVNQAEYRRRGGDEWLKVLWQGLDYKFKEKQRVLILGTESIPASAFFLDPTVGFRCCAITQ